MNAHRLRYVPPVTGTIVGVSVWCVCHTMLRLAVWARRRNREPL